jgi:hypothetical protein
MTAGTPPAAAQPHRGRTAVGSDLNGPEEGGSDGKPGWGIPGGGD